MELSTVMKVHVRVIVVLEAASDKANCLDTLLWEEYNHWFEGHKHIDKAYEILYSMRGRLKAITVELGSTRIYAMARFQNVFQENDLNETIFPYLERCAYLFYIVSSKWEDDNFSIFGSSCDSNNSK